MTSVIHLEIIGTATEQRENAMRLRERREAAKARLGDAQRSMRCQLLCQINVGYFRKHSDIFLLLPIVGTIYAGSVRQEYFLPFLLFFFPSFCPEAGSRTDAVMNWGGRSRRKYIRIKTRAHAQ